MILYNTVSFYFSDSHWKPDFTCVVLLMFFLQDDVPTARDLMMRYATNKKTTKRKKKLEKAMKVLKVRRVVSHLVAFYLKPSSAGLLLPLPASCWRLF